jgi:hypothetical protein
MLNPLLHTSNSCPTSPMVTRSIHIQQQQQHHQQHPQQHQIGFVVMPPGQQQPKVSMATNAIVAAVVARRPRMTRDNSPNNSRRRLSRVVKCRTLDFTEFPEGMREYAFYAHAANNNNGPDPAMMQQRPHSQYGNGSSKMLVRESRSQPGSPVSIPKIQVSDFGDVLGRFRLGGGGTGSEVRNFNLVESAKL